VKEQLLHGDGLFPFAPNTGKYRATGAARLIFFCSASSKIDGAVASALVSDARSNTVSTFIGSSGSFVRSPYALRKTIS